MMHAHLDKDVEIMFSVQNKQIVGRNNLRVVLSPSYNRKAMSNCLENNINTTWEDRMSKNPKLWNGTKFRIDRAYEEDGFVVFELGITCYKDFIGTNWSPNAKNILQLGMKNFGNSHAHMSDALGVGAIVKTKDDKVIFLKRSEHCGEAVGLFDHPGGHPEPHVLVGKIPMEEIDLNKMKTSDVVNEIFDSILKETVDEVNIPLSTLSEPIFIGITRNTTSSGRPSSYFFIECSLTSDEIRKRYKSGNHLEAEESTEIAMVSTDDVLRLQDSSPTFWEMLAPSGKGCVTLYQLFTRDCDIVPTFHQGLNTGVLAD